MAATIDIEDFKSFVGSKNFSALQFQNARKGLFYVTKITFGASDTYATNGVSADLRQNGASSVIFAIFNTGALGLHCEYDTTNNKIKMYEATGAEVTNADTQLQSKTIYALVFAQQ